MRATERLDEIEARAAAATEGPWTVTVIERGDRLIETPESRDAGDYPAAEVKTGQDAEFIAHARQDVPDLVAALRAIEAVRSDLTTRGEELDQRPGNGSIASHRNEGRAYGYLEAARLIEDAITAALDGTR